MSMLNSPEASILKFIHERIESRERIEQIGQVQKFMEAKAIMRESEKEGRE